ncbi:unnamed protein product [Arabis nemorensis]|uniref:Uncharacterized protein n=1 Tax=Arabis nemorensis TaxID=586526 RepID=A0A565BTE2_9BRAS|nr:unnamed protein product [Arabis nemorensis]
MEDAELDRQIRSLNNGSQQLDNILAMERTESVRWGLGYQGGSGCDREGQSERIIFVKSSVATDIPQKQDGSVQSPGHV